jgi:hypothetical protein
VTSSNSNPDTTDAAGGVGPYAAHTAEELPDDLPVLLETHSGDLVHECEIGLARIHDADYLDPGSKTVIEDVDDLGDTGVYIEMTLADARDMGAAFCCDCFTKAWVESDHG